jgi:hypothetical protein
MGEIAINFNGWRGFPGMRGDSSFEKERKEYRKEKGILDDLEKELALADIGEKPPAVKSLKELEKEFDEGKLISPELPEEEEEQTEEDELNERRKQILLRIREIMASSARNRSEQLRALMAQAPRGMEGMMQEIVRKYTSVLNEPTAPIEAPAKIETQTGTIFQAYNDRDEKRGDPYGRPAEGPGLYSEGDRSRDFAAVRGAPDTSAEGAIKRMLGKDEKQDDMANYRQ